MIKNWLDVFLYNLKQNKLFIGLNILGISIGVAGLIFAILFWNNEHAYNQWNPDKDIIYQVTKEYNGEYFETIGTPVGGLIQRAFPEVNSCYFDEYDKGILTYKGDHTFVNRILDAESNFFDFFPFEFTKGNIKTALRDQNSIAISAALAENLFDKEPLGEQVEINDKVYVVHGIYKKNFKSSIIPDVVIRSRIDESIRTGQNDWDRSYLQLLLKVDNKDKLTKINDYIEKVHYQNMTVAQAKREGITPQAFEAKYGSGHVELEPLSTARLYSKVDGYPESRGNLKLLVISMGLSLIILILSIVNYVNLATVNATKRAKEVGVRKVSGATKKIIVYQFTFETMLITFFSLLIALMFVELTLPFYNNFLQKSLSLNTGEFYLQLIIIFITVVCLAGLLPAIYVANFNAINVLKGNFSRSKSGTWFRNGMLVFQFAIASFFIIGANIVHNQVNHLIDKDLGFNGNQLVDIKSYNWKTYDQYRTIKNEISRIPGVKEVSSGMFSFGEGGYSFTTIVYKDVSINAALDMPIDFGMLEMLDVNMVQGRYLSEKFSSDTLNAILINQKAFEQLGDPDLLGNRIQWKLKNVKVVGVVENFNITDPSEEVPPMIFYHMKTVPDYAYASDIFVKIAPKNMEKTLASIEAFWKKNVDVNYPFNYGFVNKKFERSFVTYKKQKELFTLLNIIVVIIALFGLFALASYSIQRRMKGIAIRKVLGAETNTLMKELSKQYVVFCLLGILIALLPAYYLLDKWLENFAYRIDISIIPFIICFITLMTLTLIIVLSRAYQATKMDILKYLKYE